jgi:glycosyltransferase involved in cell wall biosynthesis
MRVLMVSPHPVYSPRGTPISVFNRCQALCALGHRVELVTYPVGEDRPVEGLRYLRASMPGVRTVAVGPSIHKLVLNAAVTVRSLRQAAGGRSRYDVVHTHEEAGLFGPALARLSGVPHVYDMGNDWADVLGNYGLRARNPLTRAATTLESAVIRHSDAVIAHFPLIAHRIATTTATPVETIFNISLEPEPDQALAATIRRTWAPVGVKVILYAGTLEPYQGVPLLVDAMAEVGRTHAEALLVVAGGQPDQVADLQARVGALGLNASVKLLGPVPAAVMPSCLAAADILASPRERGRNTPLKIFSYLRSGRPIVATDIPSHTQVLDARSCVLVPPTAAGLASGIRSLLDDGPARNQAVAGARALQADYGIERYVHGVARAYAHVGGPQPDAVSIACAAERIRCDMPGALDLAGLESSTRAWPKPPLGAPTRASAGAATPRRPNTHGHAGTTIEREAS